MHARYYDGKTGSFISKDPHPVNYLNTQDIDRYIYGYNNPLKYIDPTGLFSINNISYEQGWLKQVATTNDLLGLNGLLLEFSNLKGSIGSNLKFYVSGWGGNQSVSTLRIPSIGKLIGNTTSVFTIGSTAYGLYNYSKNPNNPNAISPEKAAMDVTVLGASRFGGLPGVILGVTYTAIDNLYPGGYIKYANDFNSVMDRLFNRLLFK